MIMMMLMFPYNGEFFGYYLQTPTLKLVWKGAPRSGFENRHKNHNSASLPKRE